MSTRLSLNQQTFFACLLQKICELIHILSFDITHSHLTFIELDYGKNYRKALYLMVKTMFSCRFSLNPIQWHIEFMAVRCQTVHISSFIVNHPHLTLPCRAQTTCLSIIYWQTLKVDLGGPSIYIYIYVYIYIYMYIYIYVYIETTE